MDVSAVGYGSMSTNSGTRRTKLTRRELYLSSRARETLYHACTLCFGCI